MSARIPAKHVLARWPRYMRRATAAEYCDLTEAAFTREVLAGKLPCPVDLGGGDHWDQRALDKALDLLAGNADEPDYRRKLKARYGEAA